MRVIAGSARGMKLLPPAPGTRPVADRAREGLFSSLGERVVGAACLDLFAGTGALGIEALSRGAARCTFVDRSHRAIATIHGNLERTHLADRGILVTRDVGTYLQERPRGHEVVDLAFVDPPYELEGAALDDVLARLDRTWLPAEGWTVVVTRGHKGSLPAVPVHWAARRQLRYGDSLVIAYQEVGWA